jgi:hypothetical protein
MLRAGAFVARMWLSKKENTRKRACSRFIFLTANPGKPRSGYRAGATANWAG